MSNDLETRITILERDVKYFKEELQTAINEMNNKLNDLSDMLQEYVESQNEIEKQMIKKFALYNGFNDKFVPYTLYLRDISEIKTMLNSIQFEKKGEDNLLDRLNKYGSLILAGLLILLYVASLIRGGWNG